MIFCIQINDNLDIIGNGIRMWSCGFIFTWKIIISTKRRRKRNKQRCHSLKISCSVWSFFFVFIKIEYSIFHGCLDASVYMIALFISVYFWKLIFVIFLTTSFISSTFSHNFSSSCYICVYALNDFLWEVDVYINAQCWSIRYKTFFWNKND